MFGRETTSEPKGPSRPIRRRSASSGIREVLEDVREQDLVEGPLGRERPVVEQRAHVALDHRDAAPAALGARDGGGLDGRHPRAAPALRELGEVAAGGADVEQARAALDQVDHRLMGAVADLLQAVGRGRAHAASSR